jgi:hypothetical protein
MKIIQETLTVLPDAEQGEVNIILVGHRITLTADESSLLVNQLASSLTRLQRTQRHDATTAESWTPGRSAGSRPDLRSVFAGKEGTPASEEVQQRTRALIQAAMKDKGLSLDQEPRE